jgi:hypothetical protein
MSQQGLQTYILATKQQEQQPMVKSGSHLLILPSQRPTIPRTSVCLGTLLFPRLNLAVKQALQKTICEKPLPKSSRVKAVVKSVHQNLTKLWRRLGRNYNGKHLGKHHHHLLQSTWSSQAQQTIAALTYRQRLALNLAHRIPNTSTRINSGRKPVAELE